MDIKKYLNSLPMTDRQAFESATGTTINYLRKAASIGQAVNAVTCAAIERATGGAVTRREMRPDDWWLIWPELVDAEHPAPVPAPSTEAA